MSGKVGCNGSYDLEYGAGVVTVEAVAESVLRIRRKGAGREVQKFW